MRFFIKLVLGMVLFNAFILLLVPFFPNHVAVSSNAYNVTNEYGTTYDAGVGLDDIILKIIGSGWFWAIFTTFSLIGGVGGVLSGRSSPVFIGIAIIIGLIAALYVSTIQIFFGLVNNYPIVTGLLAITTLIIGIYFVFSITDMLTGRSDVD